MNSRLRFLLLLFLTVYVCSCGFLRGYREGLTSANEAYLQSNLAMMREGIKKYTHDKGHPPQTLKDLDDAGYITYVPTDPMTEKVDWIIVPYDCRGSANCKQGIKDVHSASGAKSSRGNSYSDW